MVSTSTNTTSSASTSLKRVAVSGASGLVGKALTADLNRSGIQVHNVTRSGNGSSTDIQWDPASGFLNSARLEGLDVFVHLAGENIAGGRWNAARKQRIRNSRVEGTRRVAEALAGLTQPPPTLVCASAIGFYGDRGAQQLDELADAGSGFLAEVCRDWEAAADPARAAGIRVVHLRIGVVISRDGGALAQMLAPFRLCVGGRVGSGQQYWSWISIDDVVGSIRHVLEHTELSGPVNCVAPDAATNLEFTKALGNVLNRPTVFPMPAPMARLALGEMAQELLLASTRVVPQRLLESGYEFQRADLTDALAAEVHGEKS